jgi:hypothetical protein
MTASLKREELHAFSDGAALLGVAVCAENRRVDLLSCRRGDMIDEHCPEEALS